VPKIDPCQSDGGPGGIHVAASGGDYCIDKTEVTNGAYEQFIADRPTWGPKDQPAFCNWNTKLTSDLPNWPRPGEDRFPVAFVDWCDSWSYCKWAGKRLCGQIGGGSVADALAVDPTRSQWYLACAGASGAKYPYGDMYQPLTCNGVGVAPPQVREVGMASCEGHPPGLLDMSGNVFEWIDSCDAAMGASDSCRMAGGGFSSPDYELACDYRVVNARNITMPNLGFRCCADL
jgi:formylglycine-generating enzyme required for sulfatase activity